MTTSPHSHEARDPYLAHHFETLRQQYESGKLGMWLFLSTEILLFGGLFCAYAVYRANHPEIFVYAHQFLDKNLGGLNTIILICSSFTMAWAVRAAQLGERRRLVAMLVATLLFASGFLGVKAVEYEQKWKHGLLWGKRFRPQTHETAAHPGAQADAAHAAIAEAAHAPAGADAVGADAAHGGPPAAGAADRPLLAPATIEPKGLAATAEGPPRRTGHAAEAPRNVQLFFGIYFVMTGLHGLHVIAGMFAITWILARAIKGHFGSRRFLPVDNVGLYWHVVDIIWIYLFPLLYLIS